MHKIFSLFLFLFFLLQSCTSVKPYQRQFLNDPEMQIGLNGNAFENYVHEIREGALQPGTKKSSEGCGCN